MCAAMARPHTRTHTQTHRAHTCTHAAWVETNATFEAKLHVISVVAQWLRPWTTDQKVASSNLSIAKLPLLGA